MSKNIIILILLIISSSFLNGQSQPVDWPECSYVETREDFNNFISIYLDSFGARFINEKEVKDLKTCIEEEYRNQVLKGVLDFSKMTIEIQVDSTTKFDHVLNLLTELENSNIRKIFFVCKSSIFSRIAGIWSIGLEHNIYSKDYKYNIPQKLRKELGVPPPPPPPNWSGSISNKVEIDYNLEYHAKNPFIFNTVKIALNSKNILVNGNKSNLKLLGKEILELSNINNKIFFEIDVEPEVNYQQTIKVISKIKEKLMELREQFAVDNYNETYNILNWNEKKVTDNKFPYLLKLNKKF